MDVSNHAKERIKERCGLGKKAYERIATKVFENGITHSQTKGRLNKWVTSLYFRNKKANNIRLFGNKAYIFCNDVLVTVIQIPVDLMRDFKKMVKD